MEMFPSAAETPLGWYIIEPFQNNMEISEQTSVQHVIQTEILYIQMWYEADICGVKPTAICACEEKEIKESQFVNHVRNITKQTGDGRVEVFLPWKDGFPESFTFNRNQLASLERRLDKLNMLRE